MRIQKKKNCGGGGGRSVRVGVSWGGQVGCERRIEVFVKIQKKKWEGVGRVGEGRVGVGWGKVDATEK